MPGEKLKIDDELYERFSARYPANQGRMVGQSNSEESRREDIEDTYSRAHPQLVELFPDIKANDPATYDKIVALAAFFERCGFESGVDFANNPVTNPVVAARMRAQEAVAR